MSKEYLDRDRLVKIASQYLTYLRDAYGLTTFIDCTPINLGRDIDSLRRISAKAEINLICSTGFYHTDEPVLYSTSIDQLCKYIVSDACRVNAGIIKCAVENETVSDFQQKILRASAKAHLYTGLPITLHTNAKNQNAFNALEILLSDYQEA